MEKLTLTSTHSMAETITLHNVGEKVIFKISEQNPEIIVGYINGETIGFVVSKTEPLPGTVVPSDLEYEMENYNWFLTECRDGDKGNPAVRLVVSGVLKRQKSNDEKISLCKFTFDVIKESSSSLERFYEAKRTESLPLVAISSENDNLVLKFDNEVIGEFNNTNCEVDKALLVSYFNEKEEMVALGAMRENGTLFDVIAPVNQSELMNMKTKTSSSEFEEKIKWIVDNKITTEENVKDILSYLTLCGVDANLQKKVLDTYKVYPKEVRASIKPKPPVPFVDQYGFIKTSVAAIVKEKHLRYDGPKGAGKNLAIDTLSWVFQRPLFRVSFNKQTDESVLFGEKTLATKNKKVKIEETSDNARTGETLKVFAKNMTNLLHAMLGKSQDVVFERGPLTLAMEYGGFLNLDEINFANQANASVLNNALDDNRSVYVPGYQTVYAVENFVAISTMNDGYVGTSQMNQALRDRFYPVMFEYPSDMSTFLKVRYPNANPTYLSTIDSIYEDMVKHVRDIEDLDPDAISTRGFIDVMDLADDLGLEEALIGAIVNRADNEDTRDLLRNIIDMHV